MQTSESIKHIAESLAQAQKGFSKLNKATTAYNYKYAELADLLAAVQPALNEQGISITQTPQKVGDGWVCVTRFTDKTGEWMQGIFPMQFGNTKNAMQEFGSAFTYARRYGLQGLAGIASEDDDGASSGPRQDKREAWGSGKNKRRQQHRENRAPAGAAPQQHESVNSVYLKKLGDIMAWDAPPVAPPELRGFAYSLAQRACAASEPVSSEMLIGAARTHVADLSAKAGGSKRREYPPQIVSLLTAIGGKSEESNDLIGLCSLADALDGFLKNEVEEKAPA